MKDTVNECKMRKNSAETVDQQEKLFEALQKAVKAFENMEDDGAGLYEAASAYVEAAGQRSESRLCL